MIAERFDAFLFDLDGVVYLGDELLPGSDEALARLREAGKEVRFLTNDPRPTRRQVCRRLAGMGVQVDAEEVITSGWATANYLLQNGVESAYVIGSRGLASEIGMVGVEVVDRGPAKWWSSGPTNTFLTATSGKRPGTSSREHVLSLRMLTAPSPRPRARSPVRGP